MGEEIGKYMGRGSREGRLERERFTRGGLWGGWENEGVEEDLKLKGK